LNQSGRKATRNTVWRTLLCSFDDEHQQHYPGRTMLVAFSILTLLNQLNFLSISAWHVQTYFHSNLVRFVLRGIPAFLSILLIFYAVRIMKPKVELGQWLRWPPQNVWGRRLTAFVLLAIILVAVGTVIDRRASYFTSSSISGTYSQMCSKRCWNEREFLDHEFLRMTLTVRLRQRF